MKLPRLLLKILLICTFPTVPAWSDSPALLSSRAGEARGETGAHIRDSAAGQGDLPPVADRRSGTESRWTERSRRGVRTFTKYSDIVYKQNPDSNSQKLDLYIPESTRKSGARKAVPLPLVIWIHGGGWMKGDKERGPLVPLVNSGFAVASINYRLSGEAYFPAQIQDCEAALDWLRANAGKYRLDTKRFGVWGESAGGHLAMLLAATSDSSAYAKPEMRQGPKIKAVCDWFGPMDFESLLFDGKKRKKMRHSSAIIQLLGGPEQDLRRKARLASPSTYISRNMPPVLIMHGNQDRVVPPGQSIMIYRKLNELGVEVKLEVLDGGHGVPGFGPKAIRRVLSFFERYL